MNDESNNKGCKHRLCDERDGYPCINPRLQPAGQSPGCPRASGSFTRCGSSREPTVQQQPPPCCCWTVWPGVIVVDLPVPVAVVVEPMLRKAEHYLWVDPRCRSHYSPVLNLLSHRQERLLDVRRVLRRCLQERDGKLVGEFLCKLRSAPLLPFE